jgi:phage protein D
MPDTTAEAWIANWGVTLDGRDITSAMNPYVQSIEVTDKDGTSSDSCRIVLDDSKGQIKLPQAGGLIAVRLEGAEVFKGTVDEINSTGARGQGLIITVSARGFDTAGKVKAPLNFHKDDATLQEFLDSAAQRAGLQRVVIDPAFGNVRRDYWSADSESFVHLVERLAHEFGGTFKVRGDEAVLAQRGTGMTPSGKPMDSLSATRGENLIAWDISPFVGRPRGKKARAKFYDRKTAKFETREVVIEADDSGADVVAINAAVLRAGGDSQRVYSADEMAAIRETFRATEEPDATNYAPWQLALANASLAAPIGTLQRVLAAIGATSATGRTYSPQDRVAIKGAFDAPSEPAATGRTYSAADMAKIKAAFYSRDVSQESVYTAADADGAMDVAKGKKSDSQRKSGEGSVTVTLMPGARVEGTLILKGTRPGVDGSYRIAGVTHKLDRSGGSTTELELKQPGSGVGTDSRPSNFDREKYIRDQAVGDAAKMAIDKGRAT